MSDTKLCLACLVPLLTVVVMYYTTGLFYTVVPARTRCIWTRFERVTTNKTDGPGLYFHLPFDKCQMMFVGPDMDEFEYTCGTKDGITCRGKVSITNQLQKEHVVESYMIHGPNPDLENIFNMGEILLQSRCAEMTAREWMVDNYTSIDDFLFEDLAKAQLVAKSGLRIVPGKVKVFKPVPTNSDIDKTIKKEAEHLASIKTATEKKKLDEKNAELAAAIQVAQDAIERNIAKAREQRITDTQETDIARKKRTIEAEQEREEIRHAMDRSAARNKANVTLTFAKAAAEAKKIEAAANAVWLTPHMLQKLAIDAFYNTNKFVFGDSIPTTWLSQHQAWAANSSSSTQ